ncbi:MAG: hypothetical protein PHX51_00460 [Clostridia bacterium]|nr:hypothetical protein [Clostridia bacterium]
MKNSQKAKYWKCECGEVNESKEACAACGKAYPVKDMFSSEMKRICSGLFMLLLAVASTVLFAFATVDYFQSLAGAVSYAKTTDLVSFIATAFVCVGFWLTYKNAKSDKPFSSLGAKIVRAVFVLQIVFAVVMLALLLTLSIMHEVNATESNFMLMLEGIFDLTIYQNYGLILVIKFKGIYVIAASAVLIAVAIGLLFAYIKPLNDIVLRTSGRLMKARRFRFCSILLFVLSVFALAIAIYFASNWVDYLKGAAQFALYIMGSLMLMKYGNVLKKIEKQCGIS